MSAVQVSSRAVAIPGTLLFLLTGLACQPEPIVPVPGFFRYDWNDVRHFLEREAGTRGWGAFELRRDSSGSRLYVYGFSRVATVEESGKLVPVSKPLPTNELCGAEGASEETCEGIDRRAYLNDAGDWAVWMSTTEAHFADWTRPVSRAWLRVDPDVKHYLVEPKEGGLELGTVDGRPKQPIGEIVLHSQPLGRHSPTAVESNPGTSR